MQSDVRAFAARIAAPRGIGPLLAVITTCAVAAGCGSGIRRTTNSSTVAGQELAFAKCVRGHGVPGFPDPGASPAGPENTIGGIAIPTTINTQSPAFKRAWTDCQGLISARLSPQGKPPITASLKASLIAQAQCMRTHGVPGYQDPTFPATGGIGITDAGTDQQSPAYMHAAAVCRIR